LALIPALVFRGCIVSSPVLKPFLDHLPGKPYCTDDLSAGLRVLPLKAALGKAYIHIKIKKIRGKTKHSNQNTLYSSKPYT
jgi:hypothetical protein